MLLELIGEKKINEVSVETVWVLVRLHFDRGHCLMLLLVV